MCSSKDSMAFRKTGRGCSDQLSQGHSVEFDSYGKEREWRCQLEQLSELFISSPFRTLTLSCRAVICSSKNSLVWVMTSSVSLHSLLTVCSSALKQCSAAVKHSGCEGGEGGRLTSRICHIGVKHHHPRAHFLY